MRMYIFSEMARKANGRTILDTAMVEIANLREQVEKLTKEGIEYREKWLSEQSRNLSEEAEFEILSQQVVALEYLSVVDTAAIENLHEQLAALAEQNEKLREILKRIHNAKEPWSMWDIEQALSLPDLATPVLNRIKAEGMRMAAELVEAHHTWITNVAAGKLLRAKADELEQSK